ncbi:MAG: glycosyltransferase family 39 protein [Bacteroidetes bacterium]|nr:glycosyltransferase family 39 protein [Bacteroidota bacterium]
MDNPAWGILTILISGTAYLISYQYKRRSQYGVAIWLLMLAGVILRIFAACDFYLHPWDEVFHAVVAKHMIVHPFTPTLYEHPLLPYDYRNWTGNHIWLHKQPLPLWSMALSMSVFGVNELALRLPSIILTTLGVAMTFYIGAYFFDKRTGYLAAFFYSINGLIIEMTAGRVATDHVDVFFLFFIELAIFFTIVFARSQKSIYNIAAGLSIGAAILCKWLPALIVLPIWLIVVIDSKQFTPSAIARQFTVLLLVTVAIFLPWQIYIYHKFPWEAQSEAAHNFRHITEVLDNQGGPLYYYLTKIRINYGELVYIPLIWFLVTCLSWRNLKRWSLAIWFVIPTVFFSVLKTKMQGYILFCAPALFIVTSAFFFTLKDFVWHRTIKPIYKYGLVLILTLFIALPVRYGLERIKPFEKKRTPPWVTYLNSRSDKNNSDIVLLNYPHDIAAMFYTDWTVYAYIPPDKDLHKLINSGRKVIINDRGNLPLKIRYMKGVEILMLCDATN